MAVYSHEVQMVDLRSSIDQEHCCDHSTCLNGLYIFMVPFVFLF